jgi:hypothetical protein
MGLLVDWTTATLETIPRRQHKVVRCFVKNL